MNLSVSGQGISAEPQTRVARESRVNSVQHEAQEAMAPHEKAKAAAAAAAVDAEIARTPSCVVDPVCVCQAAFDGDVTALSALLAADRASANAVGFVRAIPHESGDVQHGTGDASVLLGMWTPGFDTYGLQPVGNRDYKRPRRALPLQYASWAGQTEAARLLLSVDAKDRADPPDFTWSAESIAVCGRHKEMQGLLGARR